MPHNDCSAIIEEVCKEGSLELLAEEYIFSCCIFEKKENENEGEKKKAKSKKSRFPNLAGFCRYCGIGQREYDALAKKYPDEFEKLAAILEDEALNSEISPSLLATYLKRRLGYGDAPSPSGSDVDIGQLKLVFEHDIFEDGE